MSFPGKNALPVLGVGLSFRPEIASSIYESLDELDFMEIILDNAVAGGVDERFFQDVVAHMPVVGHGVNCSLGSLEPLDQEYLHCMRRFARQLQCRWFSDHLAFTQSAEMDVGQLMPVQFEEANVGWIAARIREAARTVGVPFLLENIAYYFTIPGATLTEIEFTRRILSSAGCGFLLDVHNLHANAVNHGFDPYEYIDRIPAEAVVEIHVAGGEQRGELYIDTHGHAINSEVWALLDYAVATKRPNAILLEREKNFPEMTALVAEIREIRKIWARHCADVRPFREKNNVCGVRESLSLPPVGAP